MLKDNPVHRIHHCSPDLKIWSLLENTINEEIDEHLRFPIDLLLYFSDLFLFQVDIPLS
jgi:hypothetical protein